MVGGVRSSMVLGLIFILILAAGEAHETHIHLHNACSFPVWPAWIPNAGLPQLGYGGTHLNPGKSHEVIAPWGWSGRFWARTGCYFNDKGLATSPCETGDCKGELGCTVAGLPPATLVEFTPLRNPKTLLDYYDVSLVDGYNVPVQVIPSNPSCKTAGCDRDLNPTCPRELAVENSRGGVIACKSPCLEFKEDKYCCTGLYNTPSKCRANAYTRYFKNSCPNAYSYPFDSISSGFSCPSGAHYVIMFCPGSRFTSLGLADV